MIIDPLVQIYSSAAALPANHSIGSGVTTIPRYRNDIGGFAYKDDSGEYRLVPFIEYLSNPEVIINAATIPFDLPAVIANPKSQVRSLSCAVGNTVAQHGYSPGELVIPVRGVALEIRDSQIWANIANNGVRIVRKNGTRNEAGCNVARWQLIVFGIFHLPQIP